MSIITKRGDQGQTDLLFGKKEAKSSDRIEAIGAVDELNAHFGLLRVYAEEGEIESWIDLVQKNLVHLMGELATTSEDQALYDRKGYGRIGSQDLAALEALASEQELGGNTFRGWIRPGKDGSLLTAQMHVVRSVCRRAERRCWKIEMESRLSCLYLNRLADVMWLISNSGGLS